MAMQAINQGEMGVAFVVEGKTATFDTLITDGDIRRALSKTFDIKTTNVTEVMTHGGKTINSDALASSALKIMEENTRNTKNFGACHGFYGISLKKLISIKSFNVNRFAFIPS